jgi:hypothetical protein
VRDMDENTARDVGGEWLLRNRVSNDRLKRVADTLRRVVPDPEAWAWTTDNRLALLRDRHLWIATVSDNDNEEVTTVEVQRLDLDSERAHVSLTETHHAKWDVPPEITYAWFFSFEGLLDIRFEAREPFEEGKESEDREVVFGWRLARAIGWTKPN